MTTATRLILSISVSSVQIHDVHLDESRIASNGGYLLGFPFARMPFCGTDSGAD